MAFLKVGTSCRCKVGEKNHLASSILPFGMLQASRNSPDPKTYELCNGKVQSGGTSTQELDSKVVDP